MKLRYTPEAIDDLRKITGYIEDALKNPSAAKRIGTAILDSCSILKSQPKAGYSVKAKVGLDTDLRVLVCKKYLIFYRVEKQAASIARILDGRQDFLQILFGEFLGG